MSEYILGAAFSEELCVAHLEVLHPTPQVELALVAHVRFHRPQLPNGIFDVVHSHGQRVRCAAVRLVTERGVDRLVGRGRVDAKGEHLGRRELGRLCNREEG